MVWSEGNPYPFNIYDLTGNLIMTVDVNGITLVSPGSLDVLVRMGLLDSVNFSGYGLSVIDNVFDHVESVIEASGLRVYSLPPARQWASSGSLTFANPGALLDSERARTLLVGPKLGNHQPWLEMYSQSFDLSKPSSMRYSNLVDTTYTGMTHEFQGFLYEGKYVAGTWTLETWHTLPLQNGWVAAAEVPQYKVMVDGTVVLRGCMTGGTTVAATVIGALPAGYRPTQTWRFITAERNSATEFRHIGVQNSGNIQVWNCLTPSICLDGIRFTLD